MLANLFPDQAIAWLLTYLLHSTLLLGLAWLVTKPLGRWSAAAEEAVWKLALVGALFTASLQLAAGFEPAAGRWSLPGIAGPEAIAAEPENAVPVDTAPVFRETRRPAAAPAAPVRETRLPMPSLPALTLGLWALGSLVLLAAYGRSHLLLRRRLTHRPRVVGGTLFSRLRTLSAEAGLDDGAVHLSCSSRVPVPLALGVSRSEICVPPRALAGLTDDQQEGMLAHELAHLARRDPLWLVVSHLLTCVFFFQPLNWVARRRLREISEMLSDEWAVSRTGRPLSLAGCLAEVAGWSTVGWKLPVPGMSDRPSHLSQRIRRLLDESRRPESPARRIWLGAAMVVLLIGVVAAAPAISAARAESPDRAEAPSLQAASDAPSAVTAPEAPEPPDAEEPQEHEVAEEHGVERHADDGDDDDAGYDFDHDYDFDYDFDFDHDFDFDFDADEIAEGAMASVETALEAVDGQLEALAELHSLSELDQDRLEREIERANEEIERTLKPRMEQLSRELGEKLSRQLPTADMQKLQEEMEKLGERMRPSAEEIARIHAHMDEELRKLQADGITREERQRIAAEARRMAQELRPSEEQRRAMEDLRRQHRELSRKFTAEHRQEIEKATREMREATRQMREDIQREMDAARKEMQRSREQNRLRLQEERRERQRQREILQEERKQEREDREAKPPKVSGKVILKQPDGWAILSGLSILPKSDPGC